MCFCVTGDRREAPHYRRFARGAKNTRALEYELLVSDDAFARQNPSRVHQKTHPLWVCFCVTGDRREAPHYRRFARGAKNTRALEYELLVSDDAFARQNPSRVHQKRQTGFVLVCLFTYLRDFLNIPKRSKYVPSYSS